MFLLMEKIIFWAVYNSIHFPNIQLFFFPQVKLLEKKENEGYANELLDGRLINLSLYFLCSLSDFQSLVSLATLQSLFYSCL